ncbi:hypothetical protein C8R46DRAFT_1223805 [Mycena filopes]|nr:hypothetical protein C8R46DRAFT_1223805 [Mycena filopes]
MSFHELGIPESTATVSATAFNIVDGSSAFVYAKNLMNPVGASHELFAFPIFTFLITHSLSGPHVLFDLGPLKGLENAAPAIVEAVRTGATVMPVPRDFVEQLSDYGCQQRLLVRLFGATHMLITSVGHMSKFPPSTDLVFGDAMPRETHPHSMLAESDVLLAHRVEARRPHLRFPASKRQLQGAHYLSDGSRYLPRPPRGPSRASRRRAYSSSRVAPPTVHAGMLRPTAALHQRFPAPAALLAAAQHSVALTAIAHAGATPTDISGPFDLAARTTPLLYVAEGGYYEDPPTARVGAFDAYPDVVVVLGHDESLLDVVGPAFPVSMDAWKERALWAFLAEDHPAFRFSDRSV